MMLLRVHKGDICEHPDLLCLYRNVSNHTSKVGLGLGLGFFGTFFSKLQLIHNVGWVKVASWRTGTVSEMVSEMVCHGNSWNTHPGLVESLHLGLALLGDLLVAALHAFDDALHVQVPAVVHLHDDRGVTQLTVQLSSLLQDQSIRPVPSTSPSQASGNPGKGLVGGGSPMNSQHGVLQLGDSCPARPGSWGLFWWHNVGWLRAVPEGRAGNPGGATPSCIPGCASAFLDWESLRPEFFGPH